MPHTYILRCADGSYYVGSTRNLELRMEQHYVGGGSEYTARRLPVELVYFEEYGDVGSAYAREKQIQGWSRRKREALIDGDFEALPRLSLKTWRHSPAG